MHCQRYALRQMSNYDYYYYKGMKNEAKKAVSKAMKEKAEEALAELQNCPYVMFRLV